MLTRREAIIGTISASLKYDEAGLFAEHPTDAERIARLADDFAQVWTAKAAEARAAVETPDHLGDLGIVNVRVYGAVGDGVTDDTAAIQAAIDNALSTTGRVVFFPAGTFRITSSITLTTRGLRIFGQGGSRPSDQGGTRLLYAGSGALFEIGTDSGNPHNQNEYDGLQGFVLCGLNIVADTASGTTALTNGLGNYRTGAYAVRDWRGGDIRMTDCQVENFEHGFWGIQSDLNIFRDTTWIRNKQAIYAGPRSDQFIISGGYSFFNDTVLRCDQVRGMRIRDFSSVGDGAATIIPFQIGESLGTADTGCNGIVFDGCWFESFNGDGPQNAIVEIGYLDGSDDTVQSWNIWFRHCTYLGAAHGDDGHAHYFLRIGNATNIHVDASGGYFQNLDGIMELVGESAFPIIQVIGKASYGQEFAFLDSKSSGSYAYARDRLDGSGRLITGGRDVGLLVETDGDIKITEDIEIDGAFDHDGSTVGFYGTAPVAKQTGVAVTSEAIHAALVNLGLIGA